MMVLLGNNIGCLYMDHCKVAVVEFITHNTHVDAYVVWLLALHIPIAKFTQ